MFKIKEITGFLKQLAPEALQENYDNAQLICGNPETIVEGVLTTLDCTEPIVEEAKSNGCNLIVAHHPIVFTGLKKLTGSNYVERTIIQAIKSDIAIYAIHTNYDNVLHGVNAEICNRIGLVNQRILAPKHSLLSKLETFVPFEHTKKVQDALFEAGAGQIGNYSGCSFQSTGQGTFNPNEHTDPFIGKPNQQEIVAEKKIEVIVPNYLTGKVLSALKSSHPYEEVAYYLTSVANTWQEVGSGMIGDFEKPIETKSLLDQLKAKFKLSFLKHTKILKGEVQKIAVCGGAGSFLIKRAIAAGADVFITSDIKYHEFFDAEDLITVVDVGHFESEQFTADLLKRNLEERFSELKISTAKTNTNPVNYY
jgi:dinuclear metal center YbgI/SA1388 family protein